MRFLPCVVIVSLVASCGQGEVVSISAKLAELQSSASHPSSITEATIKDVCKAIVWPGVAPYGVVVAVDGWSVAVRVDGAIEAVRPGSLVLLTSPQGLRGLLRVSDVVGGHAFGCIDSIVEDRVVVVGDYAQPVPKDAG